MSLDLDAIKARVDGHLAELPEDTHCCHGCMMLSDEVPALIAEVERLRTQLADAQRAHREDMREAGAEFRELQARLADAQDRPWQTEGGAR